LPHLNHQTALFQERRRGLASTAWHQVFTQPRS
jgi:hypothetical protein